MALSEIERLVAVAERPYVAWSGGKDSQVVLDLARRIDPAMPAIWSDDELEHEETVVHVLAVPGTVHVLKRAGALSPDAGWFMAWADEPYWRPMPPGVPARETYSQVWAARQGFDAVVLGLRAGESSTRSQHLRADRLLYRPRFALEAAALGRSDGRGAWRCHPIARWSDDDVWAYIAARGLPHNPVYDRLAGVGVGRSQQRVGSLALCPGWMLRAGWPDLWRRLCERYGREHWPA